MTSHNMTTTYEYQTFKQAEYCIKPQVYQLSIDLLTCYSNIFSMLSVGEAPPLCFFHNRDRDLTLSDKEYIRYTANKMITYFIFTTETLLYKTIYNVASITKNNQQSFHRPRRTCKPWGLHNEHWTDTGMTMSGAFY